MAREAALNSASYLLFDKFNIPARGAKVNRRRNLSTTSPSGRLRLEKLESCFFFPFCAGRSHWNKCPPYLRRQPMGANRRRAGAWKWTQAPQNQSAQGKHARGQRRCGQAPQAQCSGCRRQGAAGGGPAHELPRDDPGHGRQGLLVLARGQDPRTGQTEKRQAPSPFLYVSGFANAVGKFMEEVTPNEYGQNFVAAHNAAVALAWILPELVQSL